MKNKGSSTVEMSVIMVIVFVSVMLIIQCYFSVLQHTKTLSTEITYRSAQACKIEETVRRLRRWQWIDEKI